MQNNLSSSSGIQTPNEFSFELDVYQNNSETHTEKQRLGWSALVFTFDIFSLFIAYCLLICYLLLSFVYFDKGAFCSQTFRCPALFFFTPHLTHLYAETRRLFFSRLKLYAFNVCNVFMSRQAIETYSTLLMAFSPKYKQPWTCSHCHILLRSPLSPTEAQKNK